MSGLGAVSELVPEPADGRVYRQLVRPGLADAAPGGRVRLDALARWLQDIAYDDATDAGLTGAATWVLRRVRLRVARFPRFGERLELATFCSGLGRMWAERRTSMTRAGEGSADVDAVALWIHLDPVSGRPIPLRRQAVELLGASAGERRVKARLRHPVPGDDAAVGGWRFRASELDLAGHVNNAAYWAALEDELLDSDSGSAEPHTLDAEIEFRTPAQAGEMRLMRSGNRRWIARDDGELHASIVFAVDAPNSRSAQ